MNEIKTLVELFKEKRIERKHIFKVLWDKHWNSFYKNMMCYKRKKLDLKTINKALEICKQLWVDVSFDDIKNLV